MWFGGYNIKKIKFELYFFYVIIISIFYERGLIMQLSKLDNISKLEVMEKVKNHKLSYKTNIGFSKNMRFGVEIEAIHPNFFDFLIKQDNVIFIDSINRWLDIDYTKWLLSEEVTLYEDVNYLYFPEVGGEISSPIFTDSKKCWNDLKNMLLLMKKNLKGITVNDSCAGHIHFDANVLERKAEALFSYIVLLLENEQVLTRFYNGEFINLREMADEYAIPFVNFLGNVRVTGLKDYHNFVNALYEKMKPKQYAFDFYGVYLAENDFGDNTIEIRVPNGTLSKEIIQNNIMLTGYLLKFAASGQYDYEKAIYNLKIKDRNEPIIDMDAAFYVADFLPDEYKLDFLRQYYKDGKVTDSRKLKKSSKFY